MDDKQARKLYSEFKILKVMDRLYNCEYINDEQFTAIYNLIQSKGKKSVIKRVKSVYRDGVWHDEKKDTQGRRYLGMFAFEEYGDKIIYYGDTRECRIVKCVRSNDRIMYI